MLLILFSTLVLHRKNGENLDNFSEGLTEVNMYQTFDIILGDFNIDAV